MKAESVGEAKEWFFEANRSLLHVSTKTHVGWMQFRTPTQLPQNKLNIIPASDKFFFNFSSTIFAVVAETLNRAKATASECGKENITVMFDLAIAKTVWQIQAAKAPQYNKFLSLGEFCIELAFCSVIGK